MLKNKKAQMFILMALAIAGILAISFGMYSFSDNRTAINQRVNTMNSFLNSIEHDLSRQMYVVASRTLFVAETDILTKRCVAYYLGDNKGECIIDPNPLYILLNETFFDNSTMNNEDLMFGVRRIDLFDTNLDSVNKRAAELNINIDTCPSASSPATPSPGDCNYELTVDQIDPWHIRIIFEFDLVMSDNSSLASWDKRERIVTLLPVSGLYDPLYILKTSSNGGKIVQASAPNLANMSQGYYWNNTDAPSFLDRLAGRTSPSPQTIGNNTGIERFIIKTELPAGDIRNIDKSIIDHIYFGDENPPASCPVPGKETWFKLDAEHAAYYDINC